MLLPLTFCPCSSVQTSRNPSLSGWPVSAPGREGGATLARRGQTPRKGHGQTGDTSRAAAASATNAFDRTSPVNQRELGLSEKNTLSKEQAPQDSNADPGQQGMYTGGFFHTGPWESKIFFVCYFTRICISLVTSSNTSHS